MHGAKVTARRWKPKKERQRENRTQ